MTQQQNKQHCHIRSSACHCSWMKRLIPAGQVVAVSRCKLHRGWRSARSWSLRSCSFRGGEPAVCPLEATWHSSHDQHDQSCLLSDTATGTVQLLSSATTPRGNLGNNSVPPFVSGRPRSGCRTMSSSDRRQSPDPASGSLLLLLVPVLAAGTGATLACICAKRPTQL